MNKKLGFVFLLLSMNLWGQMDTEVYIADIIPEDGLLTLGPLTNISNNEGYDNQPYFYNDNLLLFSGTRNGQTDIAKYNIRDSLVDWVSHTAQGSEYSPLKVPGKKRVSAIRLDTTGLQRLYTYDLLSGEYELLLQDQKVGYHLWYRPDVLVTTVLVDNRMDLVVSDLIDVSNRTLQQNVGRSLHNIPNSNLVSYISKENKEHWEIKSIDPSSGTMQTITKIPPTNEDMCWLPNGSILMARGNTIMQFHPKDNPSWRVFKRFKDRNLQAISRLQPNANGSKLALVSEVSPEVIVQQQVEAFNKRDLVGFAACFADNVVVRNFPTDTLYNGNKVLEKNYQKFYDKNPDVQVKVLTRMRMGNTVIDEEQVTIGEKVHRQAAIYEVANGRIASMSFIFETTPYPQAASIVDENLVAYNARDIDGFLESYSENISTYTYPREPGSRGRDELRKGYGDFFKSTPDLNCSIVQRIALGNVVIDKELLTINGGNYDALAIYELQEGKIVEVTFVR